MARGRGYNVLNFIAWLPGGFTFHVKEMMNGVNILFWRDSLVMFGKYSIMGE